MSAIKSLVGKIVKKLLPLSIVNDINRNDRLGALYRAWGYIFTNQIKGAYYEFGVYRGDSFRDSYLTHRKFNAWISGQLHSKEAWRRNAVSSFSTYTRPFYAFDTFNGMPDNHENNPTFKNGNFICEMEEFIELNYKAGINDSDIRYFPGLFSMNKHLNNLAPAAIVNIDCDLYASAKDALDVVRNRLVQGSIILMDDWNCFSACNYSGERRAMKEFLVDNPNIRIEPWFSYEFVGQAFIVHLLD